MSALAATTTPTTTPTTTTRKRPPSTRPVVRECRSPLVHVRAGQWEYREADRRFVCRRCHPIRATLPSREGETALTLAQWHALPIDTLSVERRRVFELARRAGFPSVALLRFAATVGAGEASWRAFVRAGSVEAVHAAGVAMELARGA